jgi:predicted ester cyclase
MFPEQMKAAADRFIEEGFNKKNMTEFDEYFSSRIVDHALPPGLPEGLEGRKMFISAFFTAFPDLEVHIDDRVAEADKLVTRWTARGTHQGELMGIPPTGKAVTVTGIAIDRFENGQSIEHWEVFDQMGMMLQLGVVPAAGAA